MERVGEWARDSARWVMPPIYAVGVVCGALMMFSEFRSYFRWESGVADVIIGFLVSFHIVWVMLLLFTKAQADGEDAVFPLLPDGLLVSPILTAYGVTGFVCVQATSLAWILR